MFHIFNSFRDVSLLSIAVRMFLAVVCGGIIGIEREYKRRPAGFRTHILICLGASMTTLTSQFLLFEMNFPTDIARLGAQVVAGIGFIGAGTIIVTRKQRVKGLTTAAGLWVSAIVGLSLGAGFYEAGILTTILILIAELVFSRLEYKMIEKVWETTIYAEYDGENCLERLLSCIQNVGVKIISTEIMNRSGKDKYAGCAIIGVRLTRKVKGAHLIAEIENIQGINAVWEL